MCFFAQPPIVWYPPNCYHLIGILYYKYYNYYLENFGRIFGFISCRKTTSPELLSTLVRHCPIVPPPPPILHTLDEPAGPSCHGFLLYLLNDHTMHHAVPLNFEDRRCLFRDVYFVGNSLWVVANASVKIPPLLCTSVNTPAEEARNCSIEVHTRKELARGGHHR